MLTQFTSTVYIVQENKVLLLLHPKLKKWLPPGGHLEENELPPACARREALEETGLHVELIREEHVWCSTGNAESFERPWMCLLEQIPAYKQEPAHQHVDFIYLGHVVGKAASHEHVEEQELRWFTFDEIEALTPNQEIFVDTLLVLKKIAEVFSANKINLQPTV